MSVHIDKYKIERDKGVKGVARQTSKKPIYYLWKTKEMSLEEIYKLKEYWSALGFRVVVFIDGDAEKDIHEGLKALIRNHFIY